LDITRLAAYLDIDPGGGVTDPTSQALLQRLVINKRSEANPLHDPGDVYLRPDHFTQKASSNLSL
jgi:hypothetical protein